MSSKRLYWFTVTTDPAVISCILLYELVSSTSWKSFSCVLDTYRKCRGALQGKGKTFIHMLALLAVFVTLQCFRHIAEQLSLLLTVCLRSSIKQWNNLICFMPCFMEVNKHWKYNLWLPDFHQICHKLRRVSVYLQSRCGSCLISAVMQCSAVTYFHLFYFLKMVIM